MRHHQHVESYVNPIQQAQEYARAMKESGLTQSAFAKKLDVSRVRISQILSLLKLPQEKQDYILEHGKTKMITERKLRHDKSQKPIQTRKLKNRAK